MAIKTKGTTVAAATSRNGGIEWEDAPTSLSRRCVFMQVYGDTGTGRTSFALTAPGPIALLHASEKLEGIVQRHAKRKQIKLLNFGGVFKGSQQEIAAQASQRIADLKGAIDDALRWAKTIVIDTHTEAWELLRLARFGTLTPKGVVTALYGPVNAEWRAMFKPFRDQDRTNLIAIGQTRERYRNDKPTGIMEQAGQNAFHYMADVIVRCDKAKGTFSATIEKGWWNAQTEGVSIEDEMATFPALMAMISELDEDEWS